MYTIVKDKLDAQQSKVLKFSELKSSVLLVNCKVHCTVLVCDFWKKQLLNSFIIFYWSETPFDLHIYDANY